MIGRLIREPLIHFLLLAGLVFAAYGLLAGRVETEEAIVVTPAKVEQMASIFARTWQRPPTADELTFGVFGGESFSFSRSAVFSAISAAFSAVNPSTRAINASTRAISVRISASFSALDREKSSGGPTTRTLIQIRRPSATHLIKPESTRRTFQGG